MAKKNEALNPGKRLQAALVPDWEQPYKVPGNWVWTKLGYVSTLFTGNSINSRVKDEKYRDQINGLDYIGTKDVGFNNNITYDNGVRITDYENFKIAPANTTLLCIEGGSAGRKIGFTAKDVCFGNKLCAFACKKSNPKLIYYYLQSEIFSRAFTKEHHGLIGGVSVALLNNIEIPFPPLAEQYRIVDRIESLFAKLDEAKGLAQSALDSLEDRKAAILHQAFTGELTANWRKDNGVSADSRLSVVLSDVCTSFQYGTAKKSERSGEVAVVRMGNLQDGEIDWNNLVYSNDKEDNEKYLLKTGDVLFNRTNSPALVGKTSIYRGNVPAIFAGYLIRINFTNALLGNYLNYMLNTTQAKEYCSMVKTDGVNQSNINAKKIGAFILPVPSLREQTEIVRILDSLFEKEQKAKELYDVIDKIDLMKKAVLARAFRGELGTNDPEEESAIEQLKECLKDD